MPKCMPIDTNQHNPTKIIDGCQVLKEISTDKKQLLPKMQLCNMAELRKRKWNSQCCATLWKGNLHKVAAPCFCFMYTVQLYKDWGILRMLGCRAVALPRYRAESFLLQLFCVILSSLPFVSFIS